MDYTGYLFLALLGAATITVFRKDNKTLSQNEKQMIAMTIGWILVIYGLILSFSIGIFYNRYVTIRELFVTDLTNIQLTFRMLKQLNAPVDVLHSIRDYVKSVIEDQVPALSCGTYSKITERLYYEMDIKVIDYLRDYRDNAGLFTANILMRISTDAKVVQLVNEINSSQHYINILWFLMIFVLGPLYLLAAPDKLLQFGIDFSLLSILFTGLYLCTILNNPFVDSPVSIKLDGYYSLLDEIEKDLIIINSK